MLHLLEVIFYFDDFFPDMGFKIHEVTFDVKEVIENILTEERQNIGKLMEEVLTFFIVRLAVMTNEFISLAFGLNTIMSFLTC